MKLSAESLDLVKQAGYADPSPIQAQCIPVALEGRDVIGTAQTGTGKTAAFTLPMIERFQGRRGTYGLVLAPTREIAQQIQATFEKFGKPRGVESIVLIGGVNMREDDKALASYPQVIVATPGRLCDHLDRGNIWLDFIEMVVLDEADRMLDMGFTDQLNRVMQDVPATRQTLLFSATMTAAVEKLARKTMKDPERIAIGAASSAATTVEQFVRFMTEEQKSSELRRLIREESGSMIVFTRSKIGATKVWRSLHSAGVYDATYIHSDRLQSHREQALAEFKEGKYRILIATDVAGRGIHVDGVSHVVNYDLPMEPEDYVHRIGRTGRAGATGRATTFVTPRDKGMFKQIEKLLGRSLSELPTGPARAPRPAPPEGSAPSSSTGGPAVKPLAKPIPVKPRGVEASVDLSADPRTHMSPEFAASPESEFAPESESAELAAPVDASLPGFSGIEDAEEFDSLEAASAEYLAGVGADAEPDGAARTPMAQPEGSRSGGQRGRGRRSPKGGRPDKLALPVVESTASEPASADYGNSEEWERPSARNSSQQRTFFPIDEPPPAPLSARGLYSGTSTPWSTKSATPWVEGVTSEPPRSRDVAPQGPRKVVHTASLSRSAGATTPSAAGAPAEGAAGTRDEMRRRRRRRGGRSRSASGEAGASSPTNT